MSKNRRNEGFTSINFNSKKNQETKLTMSPVSAFFFELRKIKILKIEIL